MKVHLSANNKWVQCRAGRRPCPRDYHLPDTTVEEANLLPKALMDQLVADTRQKEDSGYEVRFYVNRKLHSIYDKPSIINRNKYGGTWWHKSGRVHRLGDKPAYIGNNGDLEWYRDDNLHREGDKPARIREQGLSVSWWRKGRLHREGDKPAAVYANGYLQYFLDGVCYKIVKPGDPDYSLELVEETRAAASIR
jgi:hypothetical protein